jgi:hypothetical protein
VGNVRAAGRRPSERPPTDHALDKGDAGPFPGDHGPYGTNMSVRRTAALDVGGYDPRLGRRGGALLSAEEPAMTRRLVAAGWSVLYAPEAAVVQQVLPERLSPRWLLRRGFAQGMSNARLAALGRPAGRREALAEAAAELRAGRDLRPSSADPPPPVPRNDPYRFGNRRPLRSRPRQIQVRSFSHSGRVGVQRRQPRGVILGGDRRR